MKREIKFRAWDQEKLKMLFPSVFCLIDGNNVFKLNPHIQDNNYYKLEFEGRFDIMQFSGLKDSDKNEIYEGDIIRCFDSEEKAVCHIVVWDEDQARFAAQSLQYKESGPCGIFQGWINEFKKKVIGNIYENPELLK